MFLKNQIHPLIQELNKQVDGRQGADELTNTSFISSLCQQVRNIEIYIKISLNKNFVAGEILVYDFFDKRRMISLFDFYESIVHDTSLPFYRNQPLFSNSDKLDDMVIAVRKLGEINQLFANKLKEAKKDRQSIIVNYNPLLKNHKSNSEIEGVLIYEIGSVEDLNSLLSTTFTKEYLEVVKEGFATGNNNYSLMYIPAIAQNQETPLNFWGVYKGDKILGLDDVEITEFIYNVQTYLMLIYSQLMSLAFDLRYKQIYSSNIISATAKIMARNRSHNMGHVLSRMVVAEAIRVDKIASGHNSDYTSIKESKKGDQRRARIKKILGQVKLDYFDNQGNKKDGNSDSKIIINELLQERANAIFYSECISTFFSYIKTRDQLLDDIVTTTPKLQSAKWFVREIITEIDANRLLLNGISGVKKGFNYKFELDGLLNNCNETIGPCYRKQRDVQVAMSNDVIGQHCIYIILENIIRNTAKHGKRPKNEFGEEPPDVIFTIRVDQSTTNSSYYRVTIFDNVPIVGSSYLKIEREKGKEQPYDWYKQGELEEFATKCLASLPDVSKIIEVKEEKHQLAYLQSHKLRTYKGSQYPMVAQGEEHVNRTENNIVYDYYEINNIDQRVIRQNLWINEPIINPETFGVRQGGWGLIEMEVCTTYLRGIDIENIEAPEFRLKFDQNEIDKVKKNIKESDAKLRLLRAIKVPNNETINSGYLGYCLYLPKPKELLIIDQDGNLWQSIKDNGTTKDVYIKFRQLKDVGILLLRTGKSENEDDDAWYYEPKKIYKHALILIVSDITSGFHDLIFQKLPKRKIHYTDVEKCFELYSKKSKWKDSGEEFSVTSLALANNHFAFLIEVWRAYITNRMLDNGFNKFDKADLDDLLPDIEAGKEYDIIYDLHAEEYEKWGGNNWNGEYCVIFESKFKDIIENITSADNDFSTTINQFKAIDAALTNVVVIDERIQQLSEIDYFPEGSLKPLTYQEIWHYMNVYIIPRNEIDLNIQTFDTNYEELIINLIKKEFGENGIRQKSGLDFVIIHLGILEKILNTQDGKSKDSEEDMIGLMNRISSAVPVCKLPGAVNSSAEIIITSGRGQSPYEWSKEMCFLSYSVIAQYLIEQRLKLYLCESIYSSRPKI